MTCLYLVFDYGAESLPPESSKNKPPADNFKFFLIYFQTIRAVSRSPQQE